MRASSMGVHARDAVPGGAVAPRATAVCAGCAIAATLCMPTVTESDRLHDDASSSTLWRARPEEAEPPILVSDRDGPRQSSRSSRKARQCRRRGTLRRCVNRTSVGNQIFYPTKIKIRKSHGVAAAACLMSSTESRPYRFVAVDDESAGQHAADAVLESGVLSIERCMEHSEEEGDRPTVGMRVLNMGTAALLIIYMLLELFRVQTPARRLAGRAADHGVVHGGAA